VPVSLLLLLLLFAAEGVFADEPDWAKEQAYALDLLRAYIRIPSINPPADVRPAAAFFEAELRKHGLEPKLYHSHESGKVNLLLRLPGRDRTKKPLLLLNHFDVVPVDRSMWRMDPFGGEVKDGYIWGRGALDMKGIGIQHLMTLILLKKYGVAPARDIVMLTTADEETNGTYGIEWMIEKHFAEIDAAYVLDEGGFGSREILAPGKLLFGISVGEKQVAWLKLRATGTAAHGSQPIADNANERLLRALEKAIAFRGRGQVPAIVGDMREAAGGRMAENKYTNAIQKNTISLTTLRAGVGDPPKSNVIPSVAEATLDCRLLPGVNVAEFIAEMKAAINDPKVSIELLSTPADPGISNPKTPMFAAIERAIRKVHPGAAVTPMLVPHGTDSVKLRKKGLLAYGVTPMVLDLATAGTMHSDEERIPVDEFHKGLRIFWEIAGSEF
jgi:acetylornithine deacetylase/succinyl-diaminopimelate desuccinylase-like protein